MTSSTIDPLALVAGAERESSRRALSLRLQRGELTLLLGAGISADLSLPNWNQLVLNCEAAVGEPPDDSITYLERMDVVKAMYKGDFLELVRKNLYGADLIAAGTYAREILKSDMLIALGALVMSSVRGSVADVLTLNFDDVLDWYLQLHGFRTQVVSTLPTWFSGDVDVRIHHVHGFLPLMSVYKPSDWLLLTYSEFLDRLGDNPAAPWNTLIGSQFQSKIVLAIGTSLNDLDVDVILRRAQNFEQPGTVRGYVLGVNMGRAALTKCKTLGLKPVQFDDYTEIPPFLLSVCQGAAKRA